MELQDILQSKQNENGEMWKGIVSGMAGGVVGAVAVAVFESFLEDKHKSDSLSPAVKATNAILDIANQRMLTEEAEHDIAKVGKYPFGVLIGGAYGGLVEKFPKAKSNNGLALSGLVYTAVNQSIMPSQNVVNTFLNNPLKEENREVFSLTLFGLTTEFVRRAVREMLG